MQKQRSIHNVWGQTKKIDCIVPGLYLGNELEAGSAELLKSNGITHVLPVGQGLRRNFPKDFVYYPEVIRVLDSEFEDLLTNFDKTYEFIDNVLQSGKSVLVHCSAGVSRSATVVLAYLMRKYEWKYEEAYNFARSKRRVIAPNPGFVQQLQIYWAMKYTVDTNNDEYKNYLDELKESKVRALKLSFSLKQHQPIPVK